MVVVWEPWPLGYIKGNNYPLHYKLFKHYQDCFHEAKLSSLNPLFNYQCKPWGNLQWYVCIMRGKTPLIH